MSTDKLLESKRIYEEEDEDDPEETFLNDISVTTSENSKAMTNYADLDSLESYLSEKEKDLELAAKIGKSLLERNKELQKTNEFLDEQVQLANEHVTQLKHELQQKVDLLQLFTELESESGGSTPNSERLSNWNGFQKKLFILEEENLCLKLEANHLKSLTQNLEDKEHQLMTDCVKQLAEANAQIDHLSVDLLSKNEQCSLHKRQLEHLQKELSEKHNTEKRLCCENEELTVHLRAAQETQMELAQELADLQDRYAEIVALLTETREELKTMKDSDYLGYHNDHSPFPDSLYDSLASELEASDNGQNIYSPFFTPYKSKTKSDDQQTNLLHLMESLKNSLQKEEEKQKKNLSTINVITSTPKKVTNWQKTNSIDEADDSTDGNGWKAKRICQEIEMGLQTSPFKYTFPKDHLSNYKTKGIGVPGKPGSKDLEYAIKRLSLRRRVELEFQKYRQENKINATGSSFIRHTTSCYPNAETTQGLMSLLQQGKTIDELESESKVPTCSTPKLVLVKPVDGSETLAQWKQLATPGLSCGLQRRSGVKVKSGSPPAVDCRLSNVKLDRLDTAAVPIRSGLDSGICSDVESSINVSSSKVNNIASAANMTTPGTYSFITSRVVHPSENVNFSSNFSACSTTTGTSTFSTAFSLAQALKERCVDVVTGTWWEWPKRESPMMISTENKVTKIKNPADTISTGLESLLNDTDTLLTSPMQLGIVTRASMRRGKSKAQSKV